MSTTHLRGHMAFVPLFLALVAGAALGPADRLPGPAGPGLGAAAAMTRDAMMAHARASRFDALAGDEQRLLLLDSVTGEATYGPLARIEPEVGTFAVPRSELGRGRIIARLVNLDDTPYPKLGLGPRDTVYLWVDSVETGEWRSVLIPANPERPVVSHRLGINEHSGHDWLQASGRWLWRESGSGVWVGCVQFGCCYFEDDIGG